MVELPDPVPYCLHSKLRYLSRPLFSDQKAYQLQRCIVTANRKGGEEETKYEIVVEREEGEEGRAE